MTYIVRAPTWPSWGKASSFQGTHEGPLRPALCANENLVCPHNLSEYADVPVVPFKLLELKGAQAACK